MNLGGVGSEGVLPGADEVGDVRLFVEENDISTSLKEGVGGGETGETTTDDDNASHYGWNWGDGWRFVGGRERAGSRSEAEVPAPIVNSPSRVFVPPQQRLRTLISGQAPSANFTRRSRSFGRGLLQGPRKQRGGKGHIKSKKWRKPPGIIFHSPSRRPARVTPIDPTSETPGPPLVDNNPT